MSSKVTIGDDDEGMKQYEYAYISVASAWKTRTRWFSENMQYDDVMMGAFEIAWG